MSRIGRHRKPWQICQVGALGMMLAFPALMPEALAQTTPVQGLGVNVSGAEYPWETYPIASHLTYLKNRGIKFIRLPIAWERLQPVLGQDLDSYELKRLKSFLLLAASKDIQVIIDLHNYGRYNPAWKTKGPDGSKSQTDVIGSAAVPVSVYADFWTKLAQELAGQPGLVGYDIMNEPNHMGSTTIWPEAAQAAVDGIRRVDKKTTLYIEGYQWASARNWQRNNADLQIIDPENNIVYEAHQYFDDGSGEYEKSYDQVGATPTRGVTDLQPFLDWLKARNARGFVGEFAVPASDPRWLAVLDNFLLALKKNSLPGAYWYYAYSDPLGGASWWPIRTGAVFELGLVPFANGTDKPQWGLIQKHQ